jgi:hypothetical protein
MYLLLDLLEQIFLRLDRKAVRHTLGMITIRSFRANTAQLA